MISLNYRYIVSQVLPVACIGCWMPGAKEVLGCPRKYFLFVYSSRNISDDLSWSFHQKFSNSSPKIFLTTFSLFRISCQISRKFAPWMPPSAASRSGNDIFLFLFVITYIFYKNLPLGCPPGCVPGAVAPFAPPLHATESCSDNVQSNGSQSRIYKIFVQVELR